MSNNFYQDVFSAHANNLRQKTEEATNIINNYVKPLHQHNLQTTSSPFRGQPMTQREKSPYMCAKQYLQQQQQQPQQVHDTTKHDKGNTSTHTFKFKSKSPLNCRTNAPQINATNSNLSAFMTSRNNPARILQQLGLNTSTPQAHVQKIPGQQKVESALNKTMNSLNTSNYSTTPTKQVAKKNQENNQIQVLDSFSQISESLLDEGIATTGFCLPTSKQVNASKIKKDTSRDTSQNHIQESQIQQQNHGLCLNNIKLQDYKDQQMDQSKILQQVAEFQKQMSMKQQNQQVSQIQIKQNQTIDLILQREKINKSFILFAKINDTDKCIELLDKKRKTLRADVNYKNEEDWSALHFASFNGNAKLVSYLLYNEAVIDSENYMKQTPLMLAAQKGYEDVFQILMTAGADINLYDTNGDTSLHFAAKNGHKKVIELLLKRPSLEIRRKNIFGQDAFSLVTNNVELVKIFENFFNFQKKLMQTNPKLYIYQTKNEIGMSKPLQTAPLTININNNNNNNITVSTTPTNKNLNVSYHNELKQSSNQPTPSITVSNTGNNSSSNLSGQAAGKIIDKISNNSDSTCNEEFNNLSSEEKVGPQNFNVIGLIGKGSFGEVYLVEKKNNQMLYAMKVLHKSKIIRNNLTRYAMTERNVLSLTNHPFIVKMNYAFQTADKLFLILDYCPGGDLGEHLQKEKKFTEERVRLYMSEIVCALEDLHKRDVIFRDLKPDNIVLDHEGHAMLTDFGLSKEGIQEHSTGARSFCGSVAYLAPEMLKRCGHGKSVDWYLLGVVMYELLVGIPPYYANNRDELFQNIEKAPLKIPSYLSNDAKSLLKARNPAKRLGSGRGDAEEIKQHKFFVGVNWEEVYARKLKPPIPKRKIRISTKYDPNLFIPQNYENENEDYITGWSFVQPLLNNNINNPY